METFTLSTPHRQCMIDVTRQIDAIVRASGVKDGACLVFVPHTTAGVTINENADPDVTADMEKVFTELVPAGAGYAPSSSGPFPSSPSSGRTGCGGAATTASGSPTPSPPR